MGFWGQIPSNIQLEKIKNPLASEVFSEDGKLLGRYYIENRSYVKFNEISPNVINALVATEDARFYKHKGIDKLALFRVLIKSLIMGDRNSGGGSTLSQQTAKNLFPRTNSKIMMPANKLREAIIAYRLEKIYTKDEILTLYLNTVPFGENIYGIALASERFFSKTPENLNIEEAAVIIGMLKANNIYNPRKNPERSKERRNIVIDQMVKFEYISKTQGENYKSLPLTLKYKVISYNSGPAPYFMEMIRPTLQKWCEDNIKPNGEKYNLYTDGLQIKTTINSTYQNSANNAVVQQIKKLQVTFNQHWADTKPWSEDEKIFERAKKSSERYKKMKQNGASDNEIAEIFNTPQEMTIFDWNGDKDVKMTPNDSIKHYIMMLHTGVVAIEPQTGKIKAWVGGINFRNFKYDYTNAQRQVGSIFKPILFLSALEQGLEPNEYFSNERKTYKKYNNWSPRNSDSDYSGYYSMAGALAKSINTVSVDILMKSGIKNTINVAKNLGITAKLPEYPSLALGVASVSLKEMVAAYAAIINDGKYIEPHCIISIEDAQGNLLASFKTTQTNKSNFNPDNTRAIVQMMKSVITSGSGRAINTTYKITSDFAGKTGTTQNNSDGWFIGASPNIVVGCWVGANDPAVHFRTIKYGQGAYMALPIVGDFFKSLYANTQYNNLANNKFKLPSAQTMQKLSVQPFVNKINNVESGINNLENANEQQNNKKERWIKRIFKRK